MTASTSDNGLPVIAQITVGPHDAALRVGRSQLDRQYPELLVRLTQRQEWRLVRGARIGMQLLHPGIYLGFNLGSGLFVIAVRSATRAALVVIRVGITASPLLNRPSGRVRRPLVRMKLSNLGLGGFRASWGLYGLAGWSRQ